jgi:transcriptional regulator GlxA family with amidase domain
MLRRPRFLAALGASALAPLAARTATGAAQAPNDLRATLRPGQRLVAFAVTDSATVIDFAGPWEVFQDTALPGPEGESAFVLCLVGPSRSPVETTAGMHLLPRFTFADAPRADIVVVGAQRGSPELVPWLQKQAKTAEVMMSVCTGAFKFGQAGLFDGKSATTHHDF